MTQSSSAGVLRAAVRRIARIASAIGVLAMALMVLHITIDVACRLFGIALPGTVAAVANYYMPFVTFLPLVIVEREGAHIEVGDVITRKFSPLIAAILRLLVWTLVAALLAFLGWESWQEAMRAYRARMFIIEQSIRIEVWLPYFVLPVGYLLGALVAGSRVMLMLVSLWEGAPAAAARAEGFFGERPRS
jgi:TRAP-type C4-dicarboxylate transport system permease small subunit